ncbi:MAG TPA: hypothetical protein VGZ22_14580 [Isosphaeraceae bacterium]|nr:hypothetical protein [Isosphaeraceae bacterium]
MQQLLDTEGWNVLVSDDFNRDELGKRWQPTIGGWSIEDGAIKGVLRRDQTVPYELNIADIGLQQQKLPATVEIRYESWSPDELGSEAKLLNSDGTRGLIAALYGAPHPAIKSKGAVVFLQEMAGRFVIAAVNERFDFKSKDRHKVRIVRQPEGITIFADGKQVISASMNNRSGTQEPYLHLVGTFGKEGAVVFFDNLEIRVPPTNDSQK